MLTATRRVATPRLESLRLRLPRAAALLLLGLATSCGSIHVVPKQGLALRPVEFPLRAFNYPSGLRVLVEKDSRTPLAGVFVVIGSGSSSDPAGKEGLAHYLEHLAFRTRAGGSGTFSDQLDRTGAVAHNASTAFDSTSYYELGVAAALPQLLRLETARLLAPLVGIPESERAVELDVVRNELRERNETGFVGDVLAHLQAGIFPAGHPYARPIGGSHQSLSAIRWEDLEGFVKTHYRPDNMTMVIIGDVDLATVDKVLAANLPRKLTDAPAPVRLPQRLPSAAPVLPDPPAQAGGLQRVEASIAGPELWVGWSLPRGFDRDGFLLSLLASAAQRRLAQAISLDRDVADVQVFTVPGTEASLLLCRLELYAGSHPEETLARVLEDTPKLPNDLLRNPNDQLSGARFSANDIGFSRVRRGVLVAELLEAQDLGGRGARRAATTHFSQDPALYSRAMRDLAEIKPERLAEYARPHLKAERARAVLFMPRSAGAAGAPARASTAPAAAPEVRAPGAGKPPREWMESLLANAPRTSTYRLANGLSVVLQRRAGLPLLAATLSLDIGSAAALDGGAAAFARGFGQSTAFNDPSEYGGQVRSALGDDHLTYLAQAASGNAEILLASLAERVRTVRIDRGSTVAYSEYELPWLLRRDREPSRIAGKQFLAAVLPGHPYGHATQAGEYEAATVGAAASFISRTHSPKNATLAVVGDFDPGEARKWIEDSFGGWKAEAPALAAPPPPAAAAKAEVRLLATPRPGATQGELRFGCLLPEASAGAVAARHQVAARLLQDRLFRSLREKAGATYGATASAAMLQGGTAWLELRADIENGKLAPALGEVRKALAALAEAPVSEEQLAWAKLDRAAGVAFDQMTNESAAARSLSRSRLGFSADPADQQKELDAVSAEDVRADFQHCLQANPTLSLVGEDAVIRPAFELGWK